MNDALTELGSYCASKLPDKAAATSVRHGELTLSVEPQNIIPTLKLLHDDARCRFEVLIDICGVDYPEREKRFEVVYHLL